MSTTKQHQACRRSYLEVRTDQVMSTRSGKTQNKVWRRSSEGRIYGEFTHPGIGELQPRVWKRELKSNNHNGGSPSGSAASELGEGQSGSRDQIYKKVAFPRSRVLQHEMGRSGSEYSTVREGAHTGPGSSQLRLVRSVSENRAHKGGASPCSGASHDRLRQSGLEDSKVVGGGKVPNTYMGWVNAAVVVKLLAQLFEGYVDTKKASDLLQVCKPEFLQELKEFIHTASPDTAFLSNFATFCFSAFISLPSSVCVQFEHTLMASLSAVEKSENVLLKDRFARLREKLTEHVCRKQELDVRVTFQNFRFVPVLPVRADEFFLSPDGTVAVESSAEQRYLSELFFSQYEAFIGRIRDGIRNFRDTEGTSLRLPSVMHFYRGVKFLRPVVLNDRLCLVTSLTSVGCHSTGTLVCFSCDGFRSLLFGIVECADSCFAVRPCGEMQQITKQLFEHEYVMAVSGLCAQPSVSVLLALQQLKAVPLRKFLVEGVQIPGRKQCIQGQSDLDPWQREALGHALAQDVCLVLGPPGSGKTRVACTVARNSRFPVLVLCESRSGLDIILRHMAPLSVACLSDRTNHQRNQQRREIWARRRDVLVDLRKLELDLALLARKDGVVALSSLREGGVVCDAHYSSFLRQPDTNSVFYSWLVEEASPPNAPLPYRGLVPFCDDTPHTKDTLSTIHPSLKWAERLENVEKKRSEMNTNISSLQERWGRGEDVIQEINGQKALYRLQAFKLKRLRTRLAETLPSDGLRNCSDVWKLRPVGRWGLYIAWVVALRARLLERLTHLQDKLAVEDRNLEIVDQCIDLENAQQVAVVGATAEEATRLSSLLDKLAPKTVIVDEATNITEAQLVTCLPQSCQNLVLLGEPGPFQDTVSCQKGQSAHLRSLVHRLVEKGMAASELKSQHRMQPQVAEPIMSTLYPVLESSNSTTNVCTVKGVSQNMFFITHEHLAEKVGNASDYQNLHEATFMLAFCCHLLLQGYSAQDIAIITTYPSQQHYLQEGCERSLQMRDVRVCLVEEFHGQECKIVLLSTVHEDVSRPHTAEYISMMLTRAQEGLYVIGNLQQLTKSSTVWSAVQKSLEKHGVVGMEVLLRCQVHQDKLIAVSSVADFSQNRDGGCILPCNRTLKSGDSCKKQSHELSAE